MKSAMLMPTMTAAEPDRMLAADAMRVTREGDGTWAVTTAAAWSWPAA